MILTAQCVSSVTPSDSTTKSGLDLVDVHTMPKKATASAAATNMGARTRSKIQWGKRLSRNMQAALAQTARDVAARKVVRANLSRRALLHKLKVIEKGGDGHCLQYSIQDQLCQQGIVGQNCAQPWPLSWGTRLSISSSFSLKRSASL